LRRTGPCATSRHAIVAVGLISTVIGASGVRPRRNSNIVCAPAIADFVSSVALGRSSECVYGMLNPMPPVPLVPIFTYACVPARRSASVMTCACRISCGIGIRNRCCSIVARSIAAPSC